MKNRQPKLSREEVRSNDKLVGSIFDFCEGCLDSRENMSMPQGAFAAIKVRKNMDKFEDQYVYDGKPGASRYNSKYMNSIWGMYNRFSVHNLKKVMDDNQAQANMGQAVKGLAVSSSLSVSMERLSYLPM